jgi:hypothetical protein
MGMPVASRQTGIITIDASGRHKPRRTLSVKGIEEVIQEVNVEARNEPSALFSARLEVATVMAYR